MQRKERTRIITEVDPGIEKGTTDDIRNKNETARSHFGVCPNNGPI